MMNINAIFSNNEAMEIVANGMKKLEIENRFNRMSNLPLKTFFIEEIPMKYIKVDNNYQRIEDERRSDKIAQYFDYSRVDIKSVNYRNGYFYLIDGNHTFNAMKKVGFTSMLCKVFIGLSEAEEATLFSDQDINKARVSKVDCFFADIVGRREYALVIKKVCDEMKLTIRRSKGGQKSKCRTISSIQDLKRIEKDFGEEGLRFVFQIIFDADWDKYDDAFTRINLLIGYNAYPICKDSVEKQRKLFYAMNACKCPKDFAQKYKTPEYAQYSSAMHPEGSLTEYIKDILR